MALTLNCRRCGHPLPPLTDEETRLFQSGAGAAAEHARGDCPHEREAAEAAAPILRTFQAQMIVREVFVGPDGTAVREPEVLADFQADAQAPSASVAVEPGGVLADALGEKWVRAAQHIALADVPVVTP